MLKGEYQAEHSMIKIYEELNVTLAKQAAGLVEKLRS